MAAPTPTARPWLQRGLLAALVGIRLLLEALRLAQDPRRFWNFEESYNATVAWALSHAGLGAAVLDLQYRSFCGGCTAVAALGAPLLAIQDAFWLWKGLALAWLAATMVLGFSALDALVGRAGAWAWAALMALPALGPADLSLMLWGNHQEIALFGVLALWLLARERGAATGLVLGLALWFCRTAATEVVVLLPLALWRLRGQRWRVIAGFAIGLLPLLPRAAVGEAGFYRMQDALGQAPGEALRRLGTLLGPEPLAERMFHPLRGMGWAAGLWLGAAGLAALVTARTRRGLVFVAFPLAYAAAYALTRFPLFNVLPRMPLNNIRYLSPWAFGLTLAIAAGAGAAWSGGRRALALVLVGAPLLADGVGWARALRWPRDSELLEIPATYEPYFSEVAAPRLSLDVLTREVDDPRARRLLRRMAGLKLGGEVRAGERDAGEAIARSQAISLDALTGLGLGMTEPCGDADEVRARLVGLSEEEATALAHGAAAALGSCGQHLPLESALSRLRGEGCPLCEAAGAALLDACGASRAPDAVHLGRCLAARADPLPEREALLRGAGMFYQQPTRSRREIADVLAGLGDAADLFRQGLEDPLAGRIRVDGRR